MSSPTNEHRAMESACIYLALFFATFSFATSSSQFPSHLINVFALKDLDLVALDPKILSCVAESKCIEVRVSPSLQVGTFLNSSSEVETRFKAHFGNDRTWSIEVLSPDTAVIKKLFGKIYAKQLVVSVIQRSPAQNYWKVAGEERLDVLERAFDKFDPIDQKLVRVPKDIDRFLLWWRNGRFVSCDRELAKKFPSNDSIITAEHIANLKMFTTELLGTGQVPSLAAGTLLGWFRNCGVIPYTTDIDIWIKVDEFQEDFMNSLKDRSDFRLLRRIGDNEYAREMTVKIPGSVKDTYADVFYRYKHNSTFEWIGITYGKDSGWQRLRNLIPTIDELCTGDLLGELFFVACNYIEVLETSYGKTDWKEPQENYFYTGHDRLVFADGNWNKTLDDVIIHY
ncbi:hypothetical protein QR680_009761 [Steinernema hermaphroditum]|uniref:Fukutin n=1 Tax=Steinernema hermaphroditum TaxID=289476 RepID=A0AA39IP26_9BILA|nr:hypothetical protein QR680_009761 [Steinernema hermaphroditum]